MGFSGRSTLIFEKPAFIISTGTAVGEMENAGKLKDTFDEIVPPDQEEKRTWEDKEVYLQMKAIEHALKKRGLENEDIHFLIGGDLINQLTITNLTADQCQIPFLGLYNACATMAESLLLGGLFLSHGYGNNAVVIASSHNATSERQYRFPTELGVQRPQTAQWTVTGAGAMVLSNQGSGIKILGGTVGKVVDLGIKDANQMGAAMAPAVFDTLKEHFANTNTKPQDYDCIFSGDLGFHGHKILLALLRDNGFDVDEKCLLDGGIEIYHDNQDTHCGGSGAGCSAIAWSTLLYHKMKSGEIKNALVAGSGALLSPTMNQQGKPIPSICHVVSLSGGDCLC